MPTPPPPSAPSRPAAAPAWLVFLLLFAAVALLHLTLLRLPYFWDEGGYYIPAALDFYHHGWLVPHYTNAHPPLPNILLGTIWHLFGFHILVTRLAVCAVAALGLTAVYRLTDRLLGRAPAAALTLLTAVYPIWFAQSTLAQADIFSAAFTLWAFAVYLPARTRPFAPSDKPSAHPNAPLLATAGLFTLAVLSKETAIFQPAALAALELCLLARSLRSPAARRFHLRWLAALSLPLLPLLAWYAYHHHVTGFTFGNPEYLRYNATDNFTLAHITTALYYRLLHLVWQRDIWLPILFALASLFLPTHPNSPSRLSPTTIRTLALLIAANWIGFSILGGALLTRYLLPVYPLILLLCLDVWRSRTRRWPVFAVLTAAAFISAWWLNPPTSFAPEDNLTYRDMIVAHQQAIDYVATHYPHATVLTAWPVSADLFNPYLGYVHTPIRAVAIEDFTLPNIQRAARDLQTTGSAPYDTAIVFTTHFLEPHFRRYLELHPHSRRGREFAASRDLSPQEIAALLGGQVVITFDHHGEWAAVLRFNRTYQAHLTPYRR